MRNTAWLLVAIILALITHTAIHKKEVLCTEDKKALDIQYNTWQRDLDKLPTYGYNFKLESYALYHSSLTKYNSNCYGDYNAN